jgi:hypothetical protein
MRKPASVKGLETLGRVRLSKHLFLRDFLYSDVAVIYGLSNIPDDPDLAIAASKHLCEELLEPLVSSFGPITIRSAYRSAEVNRVCNENGENCASNEKNAAAHIWDLRDKDGCMGAVSCIVVPKYPEHYEATGEWQPLAWWIHDHLPYSHLDFFPKLCAFNIGWHERPTRQIFSYINPRGMLTRPGMDNHEGDHSEYYADLFPVALG